MRRAELELWVKVRDGLAMTLDAVQNFIEENEPKETSAKFDLTKIVTQQAEGRNGYYLKAVASENQNNPDFDSMVTALKQHSGKLTHDNYFIWLFSQAHETTVGMKQKR